MMNKNIKSNSNNRNKAPMWCTLYGGFLSFSLLIGLPILLNNCATAREKQYKYLVTDKADNKIIFEDIATQHTQRVMTFDNATLPYYREIHIGDTIGCAQPFSDTQLVVDAQNANIRLISRADILRMYELQQQTTKRDSLINTMNQRQK